MERGPTVIRSRIFCCADSSFPYKPWQGMACCVFLGAGVDFTSDFCLADPIGRIVFRRHSHGQGLSFQDRTPCLAPRFRTPPPDRAAPETRAHMHYRHTRPGGTGEIDPRRLLRQVQPRQRGLDQRLSGYVHVKSGRVFPDRELCRIDSTKGLWIAISCRRRPAAGSWSCMRIRANGARPCRSMPDAARRSGTLWASSQIH